MPTINVLTFNVFENGYACCGSLHGSLKPRQYLDSSSQTFFPSPTEGLHRLSVSDIPSYWSVFGRIIGRIMIKPTDCSLSVFNASSLLENRFRSLEKDTSLSRNTKKERIVFPFEKKAYLCSWTITSWEMPLKDTSLWMHSWSPRRAKCGKSQDTHAKRAWEGNSPRHIEGVYSTLCLRHTEILQPSVSKSRI